ncbi:MAG: hypothetical protein IJ180_03530 [Bacteroidales bacterium]|nr:hypothetical protein [Bacteroidales bacterium]
MRNFVFLFLCFVCNFCVQAQNKIQADVTIQQLISGKVLTIKKSVFFESNGRCVTKITYPEEIISINNALGEVVFYSPKNNQAWNEVGKDYSSKNEIFAIFSSNDRYDLGLSSLGFTLSQQEKDSTRIVKTFIPKTENKEISKIIMVSENDMPIYCGYFNKKEEENKKIYYQDYVSLPKFSFPKNITEITVTENNDTIIRRQLFDNIKYDNDATSSYFQFQIPDSVTIVQGTKKE